jgi:hypothetical protein
LYQGSFHFRFSLRLGGEGGRQHSRKQLQRDRKQQLHEGDDDENREGDETEEVGGRPHKLEVRSKQVLTKIQSFDNTNLTQQCLL